MVTRLPESDRASIGLQGAVTVTVEPFSSTVNWAMTSPSIRAANPSDFLDREVEELIQTWRIDLVGDARM
jgi:hypothetical protein